MMSLANDEFQQQVEKCKIMLRTTGTSMYVYSHSYTVMKIAVEIFDLLTPFCQLNKEHLIVGSLLHDITKTRSLTTHESHAITGEIVARELGCEEIVCQIIGQHVTPKRTPGKLTEVDIVCYADKRVKWDYTVTLEERMDDICARYGKGKKDNIDYMRKLNTDYYIPIENEIGAIAKINGKWDKFVDFIKRSDEGKVIEFNGMKKTDLV